MLSILRVTDDLHSLQSQRCNPAFVFPALAAFHCFTYGCNLLDCSLILLHRFVSRKIKHCFSSLYARVEAAFYQHVLSTLKVVLKKIKPPPALVFQGLKAVLINTFCPIGLYLSVILYCVGLLGRLLGFVVCSSVLS